MPRKTATRRPRNPNRIRTKGRLVKKSLSLTKEAFKLVQLIAKRDAKASGTQESHSSTASRLIIRGAQSLPHGGNTFSVN
jgi:hypothetical protein